MNATDESRKRWSALRYLVPLAAVLIVVSLERLSSGAFSTTAEAADWRSAGYGPPTFEAAIQATDAQLALGRERVENGPDEWLRHESLARALMTRSALSATYDELSQATEIMQTARRLAPANTGPLLSDAALAMMTHRLGDAQSALVALQNSAVLEPAERAEAAALAADVQFYRGNIAAAAEGYRVVEQIAGPTAATFRRAILAKASGRFDEAIALLRASDPVAARSAPFQHASVALRIGGVEMARGDYAAAREWFDRADRQFPGYWLFEAHLAQARALDGDISGAIVDLRRIAQQSGSAEVMDALAVYLREAGQSNESRAWAARAAGLWRRRLEQLPEAAFGHAFEHELAFGSSRKVLELAERNLRARPFGEARIMMAEALLLNGRPAQALAELDRAEISGWRSAPLYSLRADALMTLGRIDQANVARRKALQLNPRFEEDSTVLIRFSHP